MDETAKVVLRLAIFDVVNEAIDQSNLLDGVDAEDRAEVIRALGEEMLRVAAFLEHPPRGFKR
jgi:hypothetical protein